MDDRLDWSGAEKGRPGHHPSLGSSVSVHRLLRPVTKTAPQCATGLKTPPPSSGTSPGREILATVPSSGKRRGPLCCKWPHYALRTREHLKALLTPIPPFPPSIDRLGWGWVEEVTIICHRLPTCRWCLRAAHCDLSPRVPSFCKKLCTLPRPFAPRPPVHVFLCDCISLSLSVCVCVTANGSERAKQDFQRMLLLGGNAPRSLKCSPH